MKKQSIARSLIYAIKSRLELDKSLGVNYVNIKLPKKKDLNKIHNSITEEKKERIKPKLNLYSTIEGEESTSPSFNKKPTEENIFALSIAAGINLPKISTLPKIENKKEYIEKIKEEVAKCNKCELCQNRTKLVFGEGDLNTDLVFVGLAPKHHEDAQGLPIAGKARTFLTAMVEKGMNRPLSSIYICNLLKCRTNRNILPTVSEIESCIDFFHKQLNVIRPKLIIALGRDASQILTGEKLSIRTLRGKIYQYRGISIMPIYHPEFLVLNRERKGGITEEDRYTWNDIKNALTILQK